MISLTFNKTIINDIKRINDIISPTYELYIVGGACRDIIMNRIPKDYDLTTNAIPEELITIFSINDIEHIPTGIKHGTISLIVNNRSYEITTYRTNEVYDNAHQPAEVTFTLALKDDLSRRDFTINALAISADDFIRIAQQNELEEDIYPDLDCMNVDRTKNGIYKICVDNFNGVEDISKRIIRCVGDPLIRFSEDPLRSLRAIRFALRYEFTIEYATLNAIYETHHLLDNISKERIRDELNQILIYWIQLSYPIWSDEFCYYYKLVSFVVKRVIPDMLMAATVAQPNPYHKYDLFTHSMLTVYEVGLSYPYNRNTSILEEEIISLILAALFHDLGKMVTNEFDHKKLIFHYYNHASHSVKMSEVILKDLKYSNDVIDDVLQLIRYHDSEIINTVPSIKRWLNKLSLDQLNKLCRLQYADICTHIERDSVEYRLKWTSIYHTATKIISDKEAFSLKDLAVDGHTLISWGIASGPIMGKVLDEILQLVIDDKIKNTVDNISSYLISNGYISEVVC